MSDYLSDDLIKEIFERLPAKSLLRFRSLSKSWRALIQSPDFISRHALRSKKKTPKILIRHSTNYDGEDIDMYTLHSEDRFVSSNPEWLDVSIPAVKFPAPMGDVVGSCNGILCLFDYSDDTIKLWNPSIRRLTTLPPAPDDDPDRPSLVGIGFEPSIDDYKIVRISQKNSFVYTLKTGAWCPIAFPATGIEYQESCVCVFNGALHWVVVGTYENRDCRYILTFDLTTHVFGNIFFPTPNWEKRQLTIINGYLAAIRLKCWTQPPDGKDNSIWILKEKDSNKCWHAVYEFGQFKPKWNHLTRGAKSVLQLKTNGHMLFYISNRLPNFSEGDTYGVYNPETGTWDPSMIMRFQDSEHIDMQTYVETLELLDTKLDCQGHKGKRKFEEISN